jgi:hypothetical protein
METFGDRCKRAWKNIPVAEEKVVRKKKGGKKNARHVV